MSQSYFFESSRLDSFLHPGAVPPAKPKSRATKSTKLAPAASTAIPTWPLNSSTHPLLTSSNLAKAGFFYNPDLSLSSSSSSSKSIEIDDQCKCFLCDAQLGGWDEQDDPYQEHFKRGEKKKCAWAMTVCAVVIRNGKVKSREVDK